MPDIEDTDEEVINTLLVHLPEQFETPPGSGHEKLTRPTAEKLTDFNNSIQNARWETFVQDADEMDELRALAKYVDLTPYGTESLEHFRDRLYLEYTFYTAEGTIEDVLVTISNILDTDIRNLSYHGTPIGRENGTVEINFPAELLDNTELSGPEITHGISRLLPAGYRLWSERDPRYYVYVNAQLNGSPATVQFREADYAQAAEKFHNDTAVGLATRPDGQFYVSTDAVKLRLYDNNSRIEWEREVQSAAEEANDVVADADGAAVAIYGGTVADSSVSRYTKDGNQTWQQRFTYTDAQQISLAIDYFGHVYESRANKLTKRDGSDGSVRWTKNHGGDVAAIQAEYIYVASPNDGLYKYDLDGTMQWNVATSHTNPRVAIGKYGHAYVADPSDVTQKYDRGDGSQLWSVARTIPGNTDIDYRPTPETKLDQILIGRDGDVIIINPDDGNTIDIQSVNTSSVQAIEGFPDPGGFYEEIWRRLE